MNLRQALDQIEAGGPGSGCHGDHCGRPASGKKSYAKVKDLNRSPYTHKPVNLEIQKKAKLSYVPSTKEKQDKALANQGRVAKALGMREISNHKPFDVMSKNGKIAIEVKTKFPGSKKQEINHHKDSQQRKLKAIKKNKLDAYTVVIDQQKEPERVLWCHGVQTVALTSFNLCKGGLKALRKDMGL